MANKVLGDTRIDKRIKDVFGQIDLDGIQTDEFTTREEIMEFEKNDKALEAKDIAEIIEFVISRPHHVNIADVLVLPQDQATSSIINKK